MKKFEEEIKGRVEIMAAQPGCSMTRKVWYKADDIHELSKDWISPEDHQAEIAKRKQQYEDHQEIYSKTAKKLNEAELELSKLKSQIEKQQPEIPEVPPFVADWYEENKGSLDYMIFETCRDLTDESTDEFENWFGYDENKAITTLVHMKNGYTVAKEKLFYLKHIEMSKRDVHHDYYAQIRNERFEHDSVETGTLPQPVITGVTFTQQEIDSMETGSYEQMPVEVEE